jgi:hypothetical protein
MKRLLVLVAVAACNNASPLDVQTPSAMHPPKEALTKTTEHGPTKATVTVWPPKPSLGEPIYLRVEIDAPAGVQVDAPFQEAGDQRLGRFKVVGFTKDTQHKPDGATHQEQTYTLEAPTSGKHRVPPLRMEMVDSRGDAGKQAGTQEILTEEVPLDIAPVDMDAVGKDLRAASGKLDPDVGGTPWMLILLAISGGAIVLSASLLFVRAYRSRRRIAVKKSAYEEAVAKLEALRLRGAPEGEGADAWFVELSAIVRGYLERRYEIRAPELTTEEFLQVASRSAELTTAHRTQLSQFLERCDRVKFAGYRPDLQESSDTLAAARAFVEDTRLRDEPAPGKAAPASPGREPPTASPPPSTRAGAA